MSTEKLSVLDGNKKITNEALGLLIRKTNEIARRIEDGTITFDDSVKVMQDIIIEGKAPVHLGVIKGFYEIKAVEHVIDCAGDPYSPNGWSIEKRQGIFEVVRLEKRVDGQLYIDGKKILLYLSKKQMNGKTIVGNDLREEVSGKQVLNAIILDYLLAHPELIPEEWKGKAIFFWGTIYRDSGGGLCVRCLYWDGGQWDWGSRWLGRGFGGYNPAALLAS